MLFRIWKSPQLCYSSKNLHVFFLVVEKNIFFFLMRKRALLQEIQLSPCETELLEESLANSCRHYIYPVKQHWSETTFKMHQTEQIWYWKLSRKPYCTYCNIALASVTPFSWLETGPESGTLELNSVSKSFFFNAVCTPLASEPNTGRDLDSDVAKIPVGSKTQRKFKAYVNQVDRSRDKA